MQQINNNNKRPIQNAYANQTFFNSVDSQIKTRIDNYINTCFLARIISCSTDTIKGTKTVTAIPLIADIDGNGNAQETPQYIELPHYRVQAGIGGFIINPVVGDIGVFVCAKQDISNINKDTQRSEPPASYRRYNLADAVMIGTIHTKDPTVYIEITQNEIINIIAPQGINIKTNQNVNIECNNLIAKCKNNAQVTCKQCEIVADTQTDITSPLINLNGNVNISGTITQGASGSSSSVATFNGSIFTSGDIKSGDNSSGYVSIQNHTHGRSTDKPNREK